MVDSHSQENGMFILVYFVIVWMSVDSHSDYSRNMFDNSCVFDSC